MKKFGVFIVIVLLPVFSTLAQSGRIKQEPKTTTPPQIEGPISDAPPPKRTRRIMAAPSNPPQKVNLPDHMVYEMVLRLAQNGWSPETERGFSPIDLVICNAYKKKKVLNKKQESYLQQIANETFAELDKIKQKSSLLIEDFRHKRMTRSENGQPTLPTELEELSNERISVVMQSVEKLKINFGKKDFAKFAEFIDENFRPR